jgi:predicted O-methyltransferase YrrM
VSNPWVTAFVLILLAALAGLVAIVYHKVRRIHLATYQLAEESRETHRETLALFSQIQALGALERRLQLESALPSMRGWAGSPDFLLALAEEIHCNKPTTVLECSSGVSTVVAARCLQQNGKGHVYSLENAPVFAEKTRQLLKRHGLESWATVIDAPLAPMSNSATWYALNGLPQTLPPIDVLVVDGPPATTAPLARYPALPQLVNRLSPACAIFLDDANREPERKTVEKWVSEYPEFSTTLLPCEKGLAVLRRDPSAS